MQVFVEQRRCSVSSADSTPTTAGVRYVNRGANVPCEYDLPASVETRKFAGKRNLADVSSAEECHPKRQISAFQWAQRNLGSNRVLAARDDHSNPETTTLACALGVHYPSLCAPQFTHHNSYGSFTPVNISQSPRISSGCQPNSSSSSDYSTFLAGSDQLGTLLRWRDSAARSGHDVYRPTPCSTSCTELPAGQYATSKPPSAGLRASSWGRRRASGFEETIYLWQHRLNIHAEEITSLTIHLWHRIECNVDTQKSFTAQDLMVGCFWVALKFFLYRPLLPKASKLRQVLQLPYVDLAKVELAIMNWVDWSPLRGF